MLGGTEIANEVVAGLIVAAIVAVAGVVFGWLWSQRKKPQGNTTLVEPPDGRTPDEMHDDISLRTLAVHRSVALREMPWRVSYLMGNQLEVLNGGPETAVDVEFEGSGSCFVIETSLPDGEVGGGAIVELRLAQTFGTQRWVDVRWRWHSDPPATALREQRLDLGSSPADDEPPRVLSPTPPEPESVVDLLGLLRKSDADAQPWRLELVTGHRYRLTNRMLVSARNVAVALDKAILRPTAPTWPEIPPASSVSFVCQPAWGSSHQIEVSWDSPDYADGRGRWTGVI